MIVQRNPATPRITSVRALTRADLIHLQQPSTRPRLQKLRDSHHVVARLLASGMGVAETAAASGYAANRVSILRSDPAFVELIAKYRAEDTAAWRAARDDFYETIFSNGHKAARMIADQLDDADETDTPLPLNRLLAITADSADRVGYTKKTTNFNVNVDFAAKLEAARSRARAGVIDVTPSEDSPRRAS